MGDRSSVARYFSRFRDKQSLRYAKSIRNLKSENQAPAPVLFKVQPEEVLPVATEFITLGQFLKAVNVIGTGGEAKFYLAENVVKVNGEPEQRRGRKLRPGDLIIAPGAPPTRLREEGSEGTGNREQGTENSAEAVEAIQNPKSIIQNLDDPKSESRNSDGERHDL